MQCGHGATAGALDQNLLFYLKTRGIPQKQAEALLIQSFLGEAIEGIEHAGLREMLMEAVAARPGARHDAMHPAVSNGTYDVDRIRSDFPILASRSMASRWSISTTPPRRRSRSDVLDRSYKSYTTEYANVHRGLHFLANAATEAYEGARDKVRASSMPRGGRRSSSPATPPKRSISSPQTFGRERIKPGDEIVLSIMEHHSNIVPWHFLRERHGAVIKMGADRRRRQFPAR